MAVAAVVCQTAVALAALAGDAVVRVEVLVVGGEVEVEVLVASGVEARSGRATCGVLVLVHLLPVRA